jgi:GxxExxY protein
MARSDWGAFDGSQPQQPTTTTHGHKRTRDTEGFGSDRGGPDTRDRGGGFYRAYDRLGYGFAESVYVSALAYELEQLGLRVQPEVPVTVGYDGHTFGSFRADLLIEGRIILEVKAEIAPGFGPQRQLLNYLRCSDLEVGLLMVFGLKPWFKKLIHTRDRKAGVNR